MVSSPHIYPPLDGSLFLPKLLGFNARHNPDVTFFIYDKPNSNDLVSISHLEFYQACHRAAQEIRPGRAGADREIVALIGISDTLLYQTVFMGIIFAGLLLSDLSYFKPFPMSPRNSAAAVDTETSRLQLDEMPALRDLYPTLVRGSPNEAFLPYPPPASRSSENDLIFYLHSSGSTGFPKPIPITNLTVVHWCLSPCILEHINYFPLPSALVLHPCHLSISLDPSATPIIPNSQNILDSVVKTKSNTLVVVPSFLEQWVLSQNAVDILKRLEYVVFAGGPLAPKIGNALVDAGVKLSSLYGATEFGDITYFFRNEVEQKLWDWVRFGPNSKIKWVPQDDGTYECQVLTVPTHQVSVENLSDVKGYASSDVFIKHPTVEGRMDDVLVLSSGEKTVPAPIESIVAANPYVNGTVMFGRGRNHVGILIEPRAGHEIDVGDEKQLAEFRNRMWPDVEEANQEAPAFSRIFKEMILVTRSEKLMLRAGKGTVIKKATVKLYEEEIDALYEKVDGSTRAGIDVPLPTNWTADDVESWLIVHAAATFFAQGFDRWVEGKSSLSATFLRNRILGSLRSSPDRDVQAFASQIKQNIVFSNPSIRQLAISVINAISPRNGPSAVDAKTDIENMIEKYSVGFGSSARDDSVTLADGRRRGDHVVILTGSTGGLGSYLLSSLPCAGTYLWDAASIEQRQKVGFEGRGLDITLLQSEKLVYVETDTSDNDLGLDEESYKKICASATIIVHNAWRLDFNLALSSLEPQAGIERMDLSRKKCNMTAGIVAESSGYAASKYISERVLVNSKLPATSFRIGQISGGPPRGAWSTTEWLPIIVKSSVSLGALPEAQWLLTWIPPHAVSNAILDVAFAEEEPPIVVNLVHPRPIAWEAVMRPVAHAIAEHKFTSVPLPLVPFSVWLEKLESSAKDAREENTKRIPAIKLLDFMRSITRLDITIRASGSEAGGLTPFATDVAQQRQSDGQGVRAAVVGRCSTLPNFPAEQIVESNPFACFA
ncbi:putative aminoadipate reductase [Suillus lakei]|nr:putative aminoadipate reductase [Suillus lakei]